VLGAAHPFDLVPSELDPFTVDFVKCAQTLSTSSELPFFSHPLMHKNVDNDGILKPFHIFFSVDIVFIPMKGVAILDAI
jgi:hypothetical protein